MLCISQYLNTNPDMQRHIWLFTCTVPYRLMVRSFHVVEIVGTTCDGVLITSRLVVTTRDSWKSRRHDFHDLESRDAEITWLSREHEQTTQKWRLKRPTHGFCISTARHNMEKYNYVMALLSLCTCARFVTHDMIKTHMTCAHENSSSTHRIFHMKRMHH